jgi:hypothetical protein
VTERRRSVASGRGHTGDRQIDDLWAAIRSLEDSVLKNIATDARLLTEEEGALALSGIVFPNTNARAIPHKLGRTARGFIEVSGCRAPSAAHCGLRAVAPFDNLSPETHIFVQPASAGTAWVLVF